MKLIQAVIDRFPGIPAYIDTRAHVYLSLGEWKKAVDDFQVSMSQFANEQSVHAGLVTAYEHLGMTELAERHRKIAARLQARTLATAPRVPSRLPEDQPQSTVVP